MTGHPVHEAYAAALDSPCPTCGAAAGDYCTRTDSNRGRCIRRVPCVRRCPASPLLTDEPSPRHALARSFTEPLHELDETEETQ